MSFKTSLTCTLVPEMKSGPFIFRDTDLATACRITKSLGFDGIELFFSDPSSVDRNAIQKQLNDVGLLCAALGSGAGWVIHKLTLTSPDASVRQKAKEYIRGVIDLAGDLQAPVIIGSMQGNWGNGITRDTALEYLGEGLVELGNHAKTRGITLLYEPLNRYETNLLNTVGDTVRFLESLPETNLKILADLFHMHIEEVNLAEAIIAGKKWIGHIHLADSNRRPAGGGHMNYAPISEAIRSIGYSGFLSAEAFPYPDSESAGRQMMATLKKFF